MTEQECWTNLTLASLRLAWPDRAERYMDEAGAWYSTTDADGDTRIVPLTARNLQTWAEQIAAERLGSAA